MYRYIRAIQLDGTYPNDDGVWAISGERISKGWGELDDAHLWSPPDDEWPPDEPPALDADAEANRVAAYTRIHDAEHCKRALQIGWPVVAIVPITRAWFHVPLGRVEPATEEGPLIQWHSLTLLAALEEEDRFLFPNSWGERWGDHGAGTITYDYFDRQVIEAWVVHLPTTVRAHSTHEGEFELRTLNYVSAIGDDVAVLDVWLPGSSGRAELAGWYIAVTRPSSVEVQDFFVKPSFRGRGVARKMADYLTGFARFFNLCLRVWVPHGDMRKDAKAVEAVARLLGVTLTRSTERWATHLGVALPRTPGDASRFKQIGLSVTSLLSPAHRVRRLTLERSSRSPTWVSPQVRPPGAPRFIPKGAGASEYGASPLARGWNLR
jgi:GNAT superfamily N-acetyltransferase